MGVESQKSLEMALGTYAPCQESSTFAKISPCGAVNTMFSFQKTVMVMHFVWHHTKIHGFPLKTKGILGANSRKKVAYLINRLQNLINRFNKRPFIKKYWGKKRKKNYERGVSNLASRSKIPPPDALERRPRRQKLF